MCHTYGKYKLFFVFFSSTIFIIQIDVQDSIFVSIVIIYLYVGIINEI